MSKKQIFVEKCGTQRAYGKEYDVVFVRDGKPVFKTTVFGNDIKWIDRAYTKDFEGVNVQRVTKKKLKKLA